MTHACRIEVGIIPYAAFNILAPTDKHHARGNTMFRAGVGRVRLVAVFVLTGPAGAYDFGTGAEAVAMVKRVLGEVASRGIPSNKT